MRDSRIYPDCGPGRRYDRLRCVLLIRQFIRTPKKNTKNGLRPVGLALSGYVKCGIGIFNGVELFNPVLLTRLIN